MTVVRATLELEQGPNGGWQVTLWLGRPFDPATPFRAVLAQISPMLNAHAVVDLPPHCDGEDFVEGRLTVGGNELEVYFEHALGYLSLSSPDRRVMAGVLDRLGAWVWSPASVDA